MTTTKWEYMRLWDPSEERMNEAGNQGWELVALCKPAMTMSGYSGTCHFGMGGGGAGSASGEVTIHSDIYAYFKRPIQ